LVKPSIGLLIISQKIDAHAFYGKDLIFIVNKSILLEGYLFIVVETTMPKRRVFISFDHDDTEKVNGFLGLSNIIDNLEFYNRKLDHGINSSDENYVKRVIREDYISPASVTIVLIGNRTAFSK